MFESLLIRQLKGCDLVCLLMLPSLRQKTAFVNVGLSYDLDQVQRIALDSYYGSQALNKANAATIYLSYYLGF